MLTPQLAATEISNRKAARLLTKYNTLVEEISEERVTEKKLRGARDRSKEELLDNVRGLQPVALFFDARLDKG